MDTAAHSIAALRKQLEAVAADPAETERLCALLENDARAGARAMAETARRRMAKAAAERARVESLFVLRAELMEGGCRHVAGVDEVGVGPLAGPVVAAAVVLPEVVSLPGLNDSKKIPKAKREALAEQIHVQAIGIGIGEVAPEEIDRLNIHRASLEAMRRAVHMLDAKCPLDHLLVDARIVPDVRLPASRQTALVHGDARDGSIAAASIVAKVHRDALMQGLDAQHPGYGLARHKGYGTAEHMDALERLGPSPVHRRSFAPVAAVSAPR